MIRVLSLGAGVQSTTMALMAAVGELDKPDCAIFADTQWERAVTYAHLDWLEKQLPFPIHRVTRGNLRDDILAIVRGEKKTGAKPLPPLFIKNPDGTKGFTHRQCTADYKIAPIRKKARELGDKVEMWIGISTDEAARMKTPPVKWLTHRWPLIERGMSRWDCLRWLEKRGYPKPPKSSCIGCPFHCDAEWRELTKEEFADTVALEREIQAGVDNLGFRGTPYLHASLVSLDQVDLRTDAERGQLSMFDNECEGMCGV